MLTLNQATELLAVSYGVPEDDLMDVKEALRKSGMLPTAVGRKIPQATPLRMALLVIGLGVSDPERIAALADLRRFIHMPGDMPDPRTLSEVLATSVKGLMDQPDIGLDLTLVTTLTRTPWAALTGPQGIVMQFGEPKPQNSFIQHTASTSLMPLATFCAGANAMQPPYNKARS